MEGKRMLFGKLKIDLQKKINLGLDQGFFFLAIEREHTPTLKTRESFKMKT